VTGRETNGTPGRVDTVLRRTVRVALLLYVVSAGFSTAMSQSMAILANLGWLAWIGRGRRWARMRWPLLRPWLAYGAISLVAGLVALDRSRAFLELRSEWIAPVLFFLCVNELDTERSATRLTRVLFVAGTVMALVGLGQVALYGTSFRANGGLGGWMTYAGVLLTIVLLLLARLIFAWNRRLSPWWCVAALLMLAALLCTQTRGIWLGLLAGVGLLLVLRDKRLLLALPLFGIVLFLAAPEPAKQRLYSLADLSDVTANERVYMWRAGLDMLRDRPLTGVGPGNAIPLYPDYEHENDPWLPQNERVHLHSNPVQIAAERGLLGLAALCWLWVLFLFDAARTWRGLDSSSVRARARVAGSMAALVAFLVAGLTEYNQGDTEVIYLVTFAMALTYAARSDAAEDETGPVGDTG